MVYRVTRIVRETILVELACVDSTNCDEARHEFAARDLADQQDISEWDSVVEDAYAEALPGVDHV